MAPIAGETGRARRSFVMCPHSDDLDCVFRLEDLIDEPVLDVDAAGEGACEIADQPFEGRGTLPRICAQDLDQILGFVPKTTSGELAGVFLSLPREDNSPGACGLYQPGFSEVFERGVRRPVRIDSRMPGIESR